METQITPRPNRADRRYKVTTIRNGKPQEQILTREQLSRLDHKNVDVVINEPSRQVLVNPRTRQKGRPCRPRRVSGLGVYVWDSMMDAVFAVGESVSLKSNPWTNTRVRRLRRAFGDSKTRQFFWVTTPVPYTLAANPDRVWRVIEALAQ